MEARRKRPRKAKARGKRRRDLTKGMSCDLRNYFSQKLLKAFNFKKETGMPKANGRRVSCCLGALDDNQSNQFVSIEKNKDPFNWAKCSDERGRE